MLTSEFASHSLTNSQLAAAEQTHPLDKRGTGARELLEAADQQYLPQSLESPGNALQNALLYAEKFRLRVFPCHSIVEGTCTCANETCRAPGKHPRTAHGFKDATSDPVMIQDWWTKWPDANIAIATGDELVVVDIDPRNGGDQSLAELEDELGKLPRNWSVSTGGGGWHIYFLVPADSRIRKCQNWRKGIDIQGDGAYVIAPPGKHVDGGEYEWEQLRRPSPDPMRLSS